jgi:hypothetical protein
VKVTRGDAVDVEATIVKDGHDILRGVVKYRPAGKVKWQEAPLEPVGSDRWRGRFEPTTLGRWQYALESWVDRYATLLDELDRKLAAGQEDLASELAEAEALFGPGELEDWRAAAAELALKDRHGKVRSRPTSSASGRASARGTSSSRVPSAASRGSRESCRSWPSSASTSSTCRRCTRSAPRTARGGTTR